MMCAVVVIALGVAASTTDDKPVKVAFVNETLRDLIERAKTERKTSVRQLAISARGHGFKVVGTTLNAIAAGTYKSQPTDDTLRAIAWLAGVGDDVAFTAAGRPIPGPPFAAELPPGVDNLSRRHRRIVIELLRVMVEDDMKEQTNADSAATTTHVGGSPATPQDAILDDVAHSDATGEESDSEHPLGGRSRG